MTQNSQLQTPRVYTARARIWLRGRQWVLGIIDDGAKLHLLQYIGHRVVVEVLPMVYIEAKLRRDMGYPAVILPACLKKTWQMLWGNKHARRPDLVVKIYIESNQEKPAGGGA